MRIPKWNVEEMTGYEPITTFWLDFSIADNFGMAAIKDTYRRAFAEWKDNYKYLTELVMVLNWKIWQWYETNEPLARLYNDLWEKTQNYGYDNLKDDELTYFFTTLD